MKPALSKAMILMTVILMDILAGMEFDLFVSSFPELQNEFSLSPFWVEALLSVNFAGFCLSLFFVGGLADRYGRKPIILLGILVFILGSVLCLWAGNYPIILMGRFLQGVGVASPTILSFLIVADTYPIKHQQQLMAMLNGSMNAAAAAAPVIGSYITLYFHWQGNFTALLLLGVVVLFMTAIFLPTYQLPDQKEPISLRGYFPLFKSKPLILMIVNLVFTFVPYWVFVGMAPLLYMEDLGVTLAHFGYYQGAFALIFAFGSVLFGLFLRRNKYDQKKWIYITNAIFILSLIILGIPVFLNSSNPLIITLAFIPFIIGQIIPSTILYPVCLNLMPQAKGRVSAVIQAARLILTAVGLQLAGYLYVGSFQRIGIILIFFIVAGIITLFAVIKNREIGL